MLVFDHSLPISGFPVDVAHKERDLVLRVEAVPQQIGKLRGGAAGDFHLLRFPHKGGQGGAVAHVGVDEMALPGAGGLIGEEIPAAGGGIAVRALEDGEGVVAVLFYQPGDTGGVVGGVGLKGSGVEGLGKGLARGQPLADGVGLVAVGDDGGGAEHPHRGVDNKGGVGHFGGVKGLGADAVRGLHEDPVAGVLAASHDKISGNCCLAVPAFANDNSTARVCILF